MYIIVIPSFIFKILLLVSNRCLLLTVCKTNEYMYWEYSVIISIFLENFPAGISWSSVCYNSDNFVLEYKHLVDIGGAAPKNYTIAYDRVYMSKINYSECIYWYHMFYISQCIAYRAHFVNYLFCVLFPG